VFSKSYFLAERSCVESLWNISAGRYVNSTNVDSTSSIFCFHKNHGIVCITSIKWISLFCFCSESLSRFIIRACGCNYGDLTSSTISSKIIPNVSLCLRLQNQDFNAHVACFAKQKFSLLNQSKTSHFRSIKLVRDLHSVKKRSWTIIGYCFDVLMDVPDQNVLRGREYFFFETLIITQLVKKFPAFCVTRLSLPRSNGCTMDLS
jgi:hypothetical protein